MRLATEITVDQVDRRSYFLRSFFIMDANNYQNEINKYTEQRCVSDILPHSFLEKYAGTQPDWGFDGLGYIVYKRTYARRIAKGHTEEWWQTVARCINGAQKIGACYTTEEAQELFHLIFTLKCNFAGRMLWQLNTPTVERFGGNSLLNCYWVEIKRYTDFLFVFENLMLGGGVGFSVRREDVHELPKIKEGVVITHNNKSDADFITPDSREGWVETMRQVLKAYFETGKSFSYSTLLVRGAGEEIKGFGGTASGPGILAEGIGQICGVINARANKKLRSVDVLDICNIIGDVVVAGNVRRSAEIALGDPDDFLFIRAKNWSTGKIPNWRSKSNNTIQADSYNTISEEVWNLGYYIDPKTGMARGEPYGFFNLPLSQNYGRLADGPLKKKDNCTGINPCAEITLASYECCNLSELYLNRVESPEELERCSILLYKAQKAISAMPFIHEETNQIAHKNMRLGLGVTGVTQAMEKLEWLDDCYKKLKAFDKKWSKERGWPESIKLTTVKPSGCQRADTIITTDQGILQLDEIGDTSGDTWQKLSNFNAIQEDGLMPCTKFFMNDKASTKRVTTSSGIELEATLNHRFRVIREGEYKWVETRDLVVNDVLPFKVGGYTDAMGTIQPLFNLEQKQVTNSRIITQPNNLTEDLAWFLGIYTADGSTHNKGLRIAGASGKGVVERVERLFNITPTVLTQTQDNNEDVYINSQNLLRWMRLNGLIKPKTKDVEIPEIIRRSPRNIINAFIDGYAMGDGSTKTNGRSFCTTSKKMAYQLVSVLRAIGINAKLRLMPPTESSFGDSMRYWISERKGRDVDTKCVHKDTRDVWATLDSLGLVGFDYDTVEVIENSECATYDLEVPGTTTYVANSYISHNTLSLLGGASPGCHRLFSKYFMRRVRIASTDPMVNICERLGYATEFAKKLDGTLDRGTVIASFPCNSGDAFMTEDTGDVIEQLELVKKLQTVWADNSVSVTAYYEEKDVPRIREWMKENYDTGVKSVSFLLRSNHGFIQAPLEKISEQAYNQMIKRVKRLDSVVIEDAGNQTLSDIECEGGACPIK